MPSGDEGVVHSPQKAYLPRSLPGSTLLLCSTVFSDSPTTSYSSVQHTQTHSASITHPCIQLHLQIYIYIIIYTYIYKYIQYYISSALSWISTCHRDWNVVPEIRAHQDASEYKGYVGDGRTTRRSIARHMHREENLSQKSKDWHKSKVQRCPKTHLSTYQTYHKQKTKVSQSITPQASQVPAHSQQKTKEGHNAGSMQNMWAFDPQKWNIPLFPIFSNQVCNLSNFPHWHMLLKKVK